MNELMVLSYDLRKHVVDMIIAGKGGHIGGRHERHGDSGGAVYETDEYKP